MLRNKNRGGILICYIQTLNKIVDALPEAFELKKQLPAEGDDEVLFENEIAAYKNKKVFISVKRYKNKIGVFAHMMYMPPDEGKKLKNI